MAASFKIRRGGAIADINVTPLVDVVLVLLIVLIVTATAVVSQSIPMDLPSAGTGESVETTLAISLDAAGRTYLDGEEISEGELEQRLRTRGSEVARAVIAADRSVPHGRVVRLMDLLRVSGIQKFAINVQPEDLQR